MSAVPVSTRSLSYRTLGIALLCSAVSTPAAMDNRAISAVPGSSSPTIAVRREASAAMKESAVVTRIKAKLAARHLATLVSVRVTTDDDSIVWLTGTVPTFDASAQAARIAMETDGVIAVHNGIVVH